MNHGFPLKCLVASLGVLLLASCGKPKPSVTIADPRAYLIDQLQDAELHAWWEIYRNNDPEFLGQIVDTEAKKIKAGLPTESRKLDQILFGLVSDYKSASLKHQEQRDLIMAKVNGRFESPPTTVYTPKVTQSLHQPKIALLDYGYLPGEWKEPIRGGAMKLADHPGLQAAYAIKSEVLQAALKQLQAKYPDVDYYQVRCDYFYAESDNSLLYQVPQNGSVMVHNSAAQTRFTPTAIAVDDLITGKTKLSDLAWDSASQDNPGPFLFSPDRKRLPSE